ncbi:MAG: ComEC/Rec2 family competence protein [Clostridia bacterium]|nr:ComEC/Rec2 family competence protein [Clostridia bacterium]
MRRPLYVVGMTFGLSLLVAVSAGLHVALIAGALGVFLFLLALAIRRFRRNEAVLAALLAAVAAFCLFAVRELTVVRPLKQWDGKEVAATLWLEREVNATDRTTAYIARVREGELPYDTKVLLWVRNAENVPDLYNRVTTVLEPSFDEAGRSDGVYLSAFLGDCTVTLSDERPWDATLTAWRRSVLRQVDKKANGQVAALLRAICFGDKSCLSAETVQNFSDAGLSHLMAVSGFHMSTVVLGFFGVLYFLGLRRRWAAIASLPIPFLFAALTGFSYSALRAGAVCIVMLLATAFHRRADGKNSLGGAVLLILLLDFHAVWDLGFRLSVAAAFGILLMSGWSRKREAETFWRRMGYRLWTGVKVTLAATVATLPIIALTFGKVALLSPVTNLLASAAASVIVVCGCLGAILLGVPWFAFLGSPLVLAAGVCARWLLWLVDWVASLPVAVFMLDSPYLLLLACAAPFALVLGWRLLKGRGLRLTAMLLAITLFAAVLTHRIGMRGVTTLTVEHHVNGSALLLTRDGHRALVLTGQPEGWQVDRLLEQQGAQKLDFLLYTETDTVLPLENVAETVLPADGVTVEFWNDATARLQGGWLFLQIGETEVLLCPEAGDAAALPVEERKVDLLIFDEVPPGNVTALSAAGAVLCCEAEDMRAVTRVVPWGVYPIEVTAGETVRVTTRGEGDCRM